MTPTDTNLIERWNARGDATAFHVLVQRHSAMVYRTCLRMLGNREDAEDVTQDCFLRLAQGRSKPGRPVGAWLHRVATNRSLDVLLSRKRRLAREDRVVLESPGSSSVAAGWDDLQEHVDEALARVWICTGIRSVGPGTTRGRWTFRRASTWNWAKFDCKRQSSGIGIRLMA
jgi:RNA polymerase sigma factor (sigma-70 family)